MLSFINLISIPFIIFTKKNNLILNSLRKNLSLLLLFILLIWSIFSLLYTKDFQITVIEVSRLATYFCIYSILLVCIKSVASFNFNFLAKLFFALTIIEIIIPLNNLISITYYVDFDSSLSNYLQGLASNKNITSFSLALKIPFLMYLYNESSNKRIKLFILLVYILTGILLYFLNTRAFVLAFVMTLPII